MPSNKDRIEAADIARVCTRVACVKDQRELANLREPRTLETLRTYMKATVNLIERFPEPGEWLMVKVNEKEEACMLCMTGKGYALANTSGGTVNGTHPNIGELFLPLSWRPIEVKIQVILNYPPS